MPAKHETSINANSTVSVGLLWTILAAMITLCGIATKVALKMQEIEQRMSTQEAVTKMIAHKVGVTLPGE